MLLPSALRAARRDAPDSHDLDRSPNAVGRLAKEGRMTWLRLTVNVEVPPDGSTDPDNDEAVRLMRRFDAAIPEDWLVDDLAIYELGESEPGYENVPVDLPVSADES
jgi:hypothetical protein